MSKTNFRGCWIRDEAGPAGVRTTFCPLVLFYRARQGAGCGNGGIDSLECAGCEGLEKAFVNQRSAIGDQLSAKQLFEGFVDVADEVAEVAAAVEEGDHRVAGGGFGGGVSGVEGGVPLGVEGGE